MATPIDFPEKNDILRRPENTTEEQCSDLHIHRTLLNLGGEPPLMVGTILSCWQFTKEELEEVIKNDGKFYLGCYSPTHPPIFIAGFSPFTQVTLPNNAKEN